MVDFYFLLKVDFLGKVDLLLEVNIMFKVDFLCKVENLFKADFLFRVDCLFKVDFFWINRDQTSFEWFVKLLTELEMEQAETGGEIGR